MILIDAASRATEQTEIDLEVIDVGKWGFLKRVMSYRSGAIPRSKAGFKPSKIIEKEHVFQSIMMRLSTESGISA
jgi:hypothetical protein